MLSIVVSIHNHLHPGTLCLNVKLKCLCSAHPYPGPSPDPANLRMATGRKKLTIFSPRLAKPRDILQDCMAFILYFLTIPPPLYFIKGTGIQTPINMVV